MQRLSGVDAGFLHGETPAWHMHVGAVLRLDPRGVPGGVGVDAVRALVARRLARLPAFSHRVLEPAPFGRPRWVEDAAVDLEWHVRPAPLRAPAGAAELEGFVSEVLSHKLDRRRPLWELWVTEPLADGTVAAVVKLHHACVDGVRSSGIYAALLDTDPGGAGGDGDDAHGRAVAAAPSPSPSRAERVRALAEDAAALPGRGLRALRTVARAGLGMTRFLRSPARAGMTLPFQAPAGALNGPLTATRAVALCPASFDDVQAARAAHGATVNDVVLAACAGALRRYLLDDGTLPSRPLVAQIPIGVHADAVAGAGVVPGNFVSAMGAVLPVHLEDPVARLDAVRASTRAAKAMHGALGDDLLLDVVDTVPPRLLSLLVAGYTDLHLDRLHPPIFNVLVSNVRGAPVPLYLAGARLLDTYALGPLLAGSGLNITCSSYLDRLDVGIVACPDVVRDVRGIARAIPAALGELAA